MNSWQRRKYESWLVPYADGTLDERRRVELESYLRQDAGLAADAEAQRRVAGHLRGVAAAEDAGTESEISRLWPQIQARIQKPQRRSAAPLAWAGGACAGACFGWAALWGPLHHVSTIKGNRTSPAVVANNPAAPVPEANSGLTTLRGKRPKLGHSKSKIARHSGGRGTSETAPTASVASDKMASTKGDPIMQTPSEGSVPAPKPALATDGVPQIRTAVGVHELSSGDTDSDASALQKSPAAVIQKGHRRYRRRSHGRGVVASSKTAVVLPQNNSTPVDGTPKPVHFTAKPVD